MALPQKKADLASAEEILICAPTGQDAQLLASVLEKNGLHCQIFPRVTDILKRLESDAGILLLAEEALEASAMQELNRALAAQEPWSDIPIVVMTTGGETTFASLRVLKRLTPAGNVTLLERPFRPITLVSMAQVALRSRRRQFEVRSLLSQQKEATRIRDEFISIASHELKTPLTSMKLQTQINQRMLVSLPKDDPAAERFRRYVEITGQQLDRIARLIEDMLDVSRINTGKLALQKAEVNLPELVREVADRIKPQLDAARCELNLILTNSLRGFWDRYRIEQVIINLLTNAIRYGGGKPIEVQAFEEDGQAVLRVVDQGVGISPENQERIFERFERAPQSRSIDGLGLGLYICRQIVQSHGGTISVASRLNEGASFTVRWPLGSAA